MEVPVGEDEFRYRYKEDRVLLDYRQFLPDEGVGQAVFLTDPELQMLRNMCEYLDRRSTWVFQYGIGYYDAPSNDDWDMIQGLVAELEGKLMPTGNVCWGYADSLLLQDSTGDADPGTNVFALDAVPTGEIWIVNGISLVNINSPWQGVVDAYLAGGIATVYSNYTGIAAQWGTWNGILIVLKEGEHLNFSIFGCTAGDDLYCNAWGYKMAVG
jgi:hypothetical protein